MAQTATEIKKPPKCRTCRDRGFIEHPHGYRPSLADCPDCGDDTPEGAA